jgi:hydroxymethylbilane synthase
MRVGTRGSALALVHARWVAGRLAQAGTATEIVEITTLGDRGEAISDKSRWVSALEAALLDGRIDIAVHSAKDVPTELPDGLDLIAVPPRADARDALIGAPTLDALPAGARVGTASLRRAAQLRALRADLDVVELRGNVDTRLRKLADGQADAIVLALAGMQRLGRDREIGGVLERLVPAAGQGALAVEGRPGALDARELAAVGDPVASACVAAERALVHALGASCHTPVGAHARPAAAGALTLTGWVGLPDGSEWLLDEVTGPAGAVGTAGAVGAVCAARMRAAGALEILARAALDAERVA